MNKIVNFPYNFEAIARLDSDNIVHNHIYNQCPIGELMTIILFMITIIM